MKKLSLLFSFAILFTSCKKNDVAMIPENSKQKTIDSMNVVIAIQKTDLAKQKSIDSMQTIMTQQKEQKSQVATNTVQTTTTTTKRKKWSSTAKGAVIGAGVGAVSGAIIDKKHGEGAIIGGLAGAALGAGTGAVIDSKK